MLSYAPPLLFLFPSPLPSPLFPPLFCRHVEWLPGKLEDELRKGAWFTAACARALVLKQALQLPKPLW